MMKPTTRKVLVSHAEEGDETEVLILAPTGRDAQVCADILLKSGLRSVICESVRDAAERIEAGSGPLVATSEAIDPQGALELSALLEAEPAWSDPPLIVMGRQGPVARWLKPLLNRPNSSLIQRPIHAGTFLAVVRSALENRQRQYAVRNLLRKLRGRTRQLQMLAMELSEAEDRERQRLAQVLHDDLQQILVGARFHVRVLSDRAEAGELEEAVQDISGMLDQATRITRQLSYELDSPAIRQLGLLHGLEWLADQMQQRHELCVQVIADEELQSLEDSQRSFLFRCVKELLFNVVKHAGTGRAVVILKRKGQYVDLVVQDEGRGFSAGSLGGQVEVQGFGLLSIRERVELMGGELKIESLPGKGSKVNLAVPLRKQSAPRTREEEGVPSEQAQETSPAPTRPDRRTRVVIVDDHAIIRSGLSAILAQQKGLKIVGEASNGREAVALAGRLLPDVILMDVAMPEMDGIQATLRIKMLHPAIRIIGLSMFDDERTAARMLEAGAERYIPKAGSEQALIAAVRGLAGNAD